MSARKPYPSDLTDLQWTNIAHLFEAPARGPGGRPRTYERRGKRSRAEFLTADHFLGLSV